MCDTMVVVHAGGVLFAKNSDRDPNEAQVPQWHARRRPTEPTVRCTHIEIPQVAETNAVLISRPFWMWGAEMGTNEHGVTIGNEAVFTDQPYAATGLTGMDLVRLGLERASTAEEAVGVIVGLLETHGQGGGCGFEDPTFTYHNSFLVADPTEAWVLETAGRLWATERIVRGVRTISNGLTIPGFAEAHRDRLRTRFAACDIRIALTSRLASGALGVADMLAVLRSHGAHRWPRYHLLNGTLDIPCMHGGGIVASSSSVAGWVSALGEAPRHWISATSAQCLALFKPVSVEDPVDLGPIPTGVADERTLWWRHERLARATMRDPARLAPLFSDERDRIEARWLNDPPRSAEAFAEADEHLATWSHRIETAGPTIDVRPVWARRYWSRRDRQAALGR